MQFGQRVALSGIDDRQNGHSFVVGAAAGAGFFSRLTCLINTKTAIATMTKAHDLVDELTVGDHRDALGLGFGQRHGDAFGVVQDQEEAGEVDLAEDQAERRHDHAFDERGHDAAEGRADDHADGEIDDVAP